MALQTVEVGPLEFNIEPGPAVPAAVQPAYEIDLLGQRGDALQPGSQWKAGGEGGGAVRPRALVHPQAAYLGQSEINGVIAAVLPGAVGEASGHVRGGLQVDIVEYDRHPVAAQHHVLLDEIRPHGVGHGLGGQSVFRHIAASPAVGNNNR